MNIEELESGFKQLGVGLVMQDYNIIESGTQKLPTEESKDANIMDIVIRLINNEPLQSKFEYYNKTVIPYIDNK